MVVLVAHSKFVKIRYKTTLISKATFLYFVTLVICVILPYIIAYKTGGFWKKKEIFFEQPTIRYKGDYAFVATTSNVKQPLLICSTNLFYTEKLGFKDACSTIKGREFDQNFDGRIDKLYFELKVNLDEDVKVTSINLILPIEYRLKTCPLNLESAVILQMILPEGVSFVSSFAELRASQPGPILCHSRKHSYSTNNNFSVLPQLNLDQIISSYLDRNVSTHLRNVYTSFTTRTGLNTKLGIALTVNFPEDQFFYHPNFWQILKWAWIQYLAIYIIIHWILTKLNDYFFENRLVLYYKDDAAK